MNIKQLKPKANGRSQQGYLDPKSCKKLFPGIKHDPIIFRSSWERKFAYWCETCKDVQYWGSECLTIPYIYSKDKSEHTYNPDFVVKMTNGDTWVVEIKPKSQCVRPMEENGWLWESYIKNKSKWIAAKKYCDDRGLIFKIFTENTINKL